MYEQRGVIIILPEFLLHELLHSSSSSFPRFFLQENRGTFSYLQRFLPHAAVVVLHFLPVLGEVGVIYIFQPSPCMDLFPVNFQDSVFKLTVFIKLYEPYMRFPAHIISVTIVTLQTTTYIIFPDLTLERTQRNNRGFHTV